MSLNVSHMNFKSEIRRATLPSSSLGSKISKPELDRATAHLKADGKMSALDVSLVRDTLAGKSLSGAAARELAKIVGPSGPTGPVTTKISAETQQKVRARFDAIRDAGQLGSGTQTLPVGPRFESFVLEDSRCPPGAMCIWAGELWNAYLPAGTFRARKDPNEATQFFVGKAGSGPMPATFYGPFEISPAAPAKVTHHTPKVDGAHYSPGMGMRPPPGMPFRGPALVVRASLFPIDSKAKFEAKEEGRVITITADSTRPAGKPVPRGIMQPRDFEIPIRLQQPPGTQYTLRVVDRDGNSLIPATKFVYHLAV